MNVDVGFDSKDFREYCDGLDIFVNIDINKWNVKNIDYEYFVDFELYEERFVVEWINVWIDGFKFFLVCYEMFVWNWMNVYFIVFLIILLRKNKVVINYF